MVLPLAPAKRTSLILMPPAVWVRCARNPPARIRTAPAIANDHLPRIEASPRVPRRKPAFSTGLCGFVLLVLDTISETRAKENPRIGGVGYSRQMREIA